MEDHTERLKSLCRVCGKIGGYHHKSSFREEFIELFGIDLQTDDKTRHPSKLCDNDYKVLLRYRKAKAEQKGSFKTKTVPISFNDHSDTCNICFPDPHKLNVGGRPQKRKLYGYESNTVKKLAISQAPITFTASRTGKLQKKYSELLQKVHDCIPKLSVIEKENFLRKFVEGLHRDDCDQLAYVLGNTISESVHKDSQKFELMYKDRQEMSKFDLSRWVDDRNSTLKHFISGVGNITLDLSQVDSDKFLMFARALEQLYKVKNVKLVTPLAFLQNIVIYSITGSKTACEIMASTGPTGGYKTLTAWLNDYGDTEIECPGGDLMNVFDNEQVIGRKHSIKPGNKVNISVITNKGITQLTPKTELQDKIELKPNQILKASEFLEQTHGTKREEFCRTIQDVVEQNSDYYIELEKVHESQTLHFIQAAIESVEREQKNTDENIYDMIDERLLKQKDDMVTCQLCGIQNTRRKLVCIGCKERDGLKSAKNAKKAEKEPSYANNAPPSTTYTKLSFSFNEEGYISIEESNCSSVENRFGHVPSNHNGAHDVILTDPVFCNPNSFQTVASVLRKIGTENGIIRYGGNSRHWTFICCDGLPYLICKTLKEEGVVCTFPECRRSFITKQEIIKHTRKDHPGEDVQYIHEFDWYFLRIGAGHYEMNLLRSFFELNWVPFLETLCEEMGFSSESAKAYAKNCKDTHKSWALLQIFHASALRELVVPYVRHCILKNTEATAKGFIKFAHANDFENPNTPSYRYFMEQTCKFSQGIINFRMAIRRNNSFLLKSAKYMTKELFHGRSHPRYQTIEIYDTLQDLLMPKPVRNLSDSYTSISTSGNNSLGEDFDFVLEEKNRELKMWIPKGVPTDEQWQAVCRNNKILEKIKQTTFAVLGIKQSQSSPKLFDMDAAVEAFRLKIRVSGILDSEGPHRSLTGRELSPDLISFSDSATARRIFKLKSDFLQEDVNVLPEVKNPVAVTHEEKQKFTSLRSWSNSRIQEEIDKSLSLIEDAELFEYYYKMSRHKNVKKTKETLLGFYDEIQEVLMNLLAGSEKQVDASESPAEPTEI